MPMDWRGLALGLLMALGGSFIGYGLGHHEGIQDAETAAMQSFMDKCVQPEPPAMCDRMLEAAWGQWEDEPDLDNPFGLDNETVVV